MGDLTKTKREMVDAIARRLGLPRADVVRVVDNVMLEIIENLARGYRWELRDFGVFEVKERKPRKGRNPRSGQEVQVPPRRVVTFRPGKYMKLVVDGKLPLTLPEDAGFSEPASPTQSSSSHTETQQPPATEA